MELHQLKTFVTVAELGSITRASEQLHLSQPAVSAQVKGLESSLGLCLFERTPRGMRPTRDGQELLQSAREVLESHQRFLQSAARRKTALAGTLRLGVGANSNPALVGRLLPWLAQRLPRVEVCLQEADSHEVTDGLLSGSLDAGFYNDTGQAQPSLSAREVDSFCTWLVAPASWGLCAEALDWSQLETQPWFMPSPESGCGRAARALLERHRLRPSRIIAVNRESVTLDLVTAGLGVGLLHDYTATQAQARGQVKMLRRAHGPVRVFFGHRADRSGDPLLRAVVEAVAQLRAPEAL